MPKRTALLTLLALLGGLFPLALLASPAAAAPGSASGTLDFDRAAGPLDDFDLGYTVDVSNTTPAAGDDVTVTITWDEASVSDPFAYTDLNLCWDAPAGWAGEGPAPTTQDDEVFTPEGTAYDGQVVGADVPGTPVATSDFTSAAAAGERTDITSYGTGASKVFRFCAHADSIDSRLSGLVDTNDTLAGSMTVTLEAPGGGPADFQGLLPTAAYVTGGGSVPPAPYVSLDPPMSPGGTSQSLGGVPSEFSYDYVDGSASAPIVVTPSGSLLTYSLETPASHGTAVVDPDGTYTYTPTPAYIGEDEFQVEVSDGDGSTVSTVHVDVLPNEAAVTVTKSAEETSVLVGEPIHYTIEVASTGALVVNDITVTDPNAPACGATIPALAVAETETITCTYVPTVDDVGTYTNVATATSADLEGPAASNDVDVEVVNAATPRLEIHKSTTQTSVEVGSDITYEIEVLNSGGVPLTGVVVADPNAPDCERTIGALAVGARSVYSCALTSTGAMVGNRANVATADSNETDAVTSTSVTVAVTPGDGTTGVPYQCSPPGLDPIATTIPITAADDVDPAEAGQEVTWTFRNSNPSIDTGIEADLNWIQVEYAVPANVDDALLTLTNPPGQTANPTIGNSTVNSPANGSAVRFRTPNTGMIHVAADGALTYNGNPVILPQLRVTGTPAVAARGTTLQWRAPKITVNVQTASIGNVPCNPNNPNTVVLSTRVAPENPILDVDKTAGQQAALPDQTVSYDVLVRNRGNVPLTGVTVADAVAPDCNETIGALAVGGSQTVTCGRLITAGDAGRLRNLAVADSDQTPAITSNPADVVVSTEAMSGLTVGLVGAPDPAPAGTPVGWTITIQNTGNTALTGVDLDAADDSNCDSQALASDLAVGATATVTCATPTAGSLDAFERRGTVANQATVTTNETDPASSPEAEVDVVPPATGWTDVAEWYEDAADWVDHWDLADGFAGGTQYRGTRPTTRAQFVRMVWRLAGEPEPPSPPTHDFTDVPDGFADAVAWAVENPDGPDAPLISGLTRTRFGWNEPITRGQAVRALFRWAHRFGSPTVPNPPTHAFTDVPASLRSAVAWAAHDPDDAGPLQRLVSGLSETRFGPNANLSRAQTASVLYRAADRLEL